MLIVENQSYYENSRDWKLGSLILFNLSSDEMLKLNTTFLQTKRLTKLHEHALNNPDNTITKACIHKELQINKNTVSRFIQALVRSNVLEMITDFHHHSKRKNIHAYKFIKFNSKPLETYSNTSLVINNHSVDNRTPYPLANRYNKRTDLLTDDFHVIDERTILGALFSTAQSLGFNHFFAQDGEKTKLSKNVFSQKIQDGNKYQIQTELTSELNCLELSDTQFIYTLLSLTIEYHLAHSKIYQRATDAIKNITPIARDDIREWLNLPNNHISRRFIHEKLYQIEGNKFSVKIMKEDSKSVEINTVNQRLYLITHEKAQQSKSDKTQPLPYVYFIKWNVSIIQELFKIKSIFIFPRTVIYQPYIIFQLYKIARSQMKNSKIIFSFEDLKKLVGEIDDDSLNIKFIKRIWAAFKKSFPAAATQRYTGKTNRGRLVTIHTKGSLGGMEFSITGAYLNTKNPQISVNILIDQKAVLFESQPMNLRKKYFTAALQPKETLKQNNRGNRSPIKFSHELPLLPDRIENDNVFTIGADDTKPLKSLNEGTLPITIKKRVCGLNITASNSKYFISRYCSKDEIKGYINDMMMLTGHTESYIIKRIKNAYESIQLLQCKDGADISVELFKELTVNSQSTMYQIINEAQKRTKSLRLIDLNNKSELKDFFVLCSSFS